MKESRTKKALLVITKSNWGGAQRHVYDLGCGLAERGYDVAVVTGGVGPLTEKLEMHGIRVIPIAMRQQRSFLLDLLTFGPLFSLIRIFRLERPDIVHVHSAKAGGLGALAARLTRVPRIIFTAHGWEFNAPRSPMAKMGIRLFSWLTMLMAHTTIAVSEAIRRDVCAWPFLKKKLVVVRLGVACAPLLDREDARRELSLPETEQPIIGMISELHPTKRIEDALNAMVIVRRTWPESRLVVLGDGQQRAKLEKLRHDLSLDDAVVFAGFKSEASRLLKAFDLFVHTSQSEALGYVVLEAGCAALPVVATRVGGIPEIIESGKEGLLVPPHAPARVAESVVSLLADPGRASALGSALHARVREHFSLRHMLEQLIKLYDLPA